MESFSVWQLVFVVFWIVVFGIPVARILRRTGISRWFVIVAFIPLVNFIALWVFAFVSWPIDKDRVDPKVFGDN